MKGNRINDHERELWVINTESLYHAWQTFRGPMREFLRVNREAIDAYINLQLGSRGESC